MRQYYADVDDMCGILDELLAEVKEGLPRLTWHDYLRSARMNQRPVTMRRKRRLGRLR